jgi:hypothetical protein
MSFHYILKMRNVFFSLKIFLYFYCLLFDNRLGSQMLHAKWIGYNKLDNFLKVM